MQRRIFSYCFNTFAVQPFTRLRWDPQYLLTVVYFGNSVPKGTSSCKCFSDCGGRSRIQHHLFASHSLAMIGKKPRICRSAVASFYIKCHSSQRSPVSKCRPMVNHCRKIRQFITASMGHRMNAYWHLEEKNWAPANGKFKLLQLTSEHEICIVHLHPNQSRTS